MIDLKELRKSRGLKQSQVARMIKCDPSAISRYENGLQELTVGVLRDLAEVYGVSVSYILNGDIREPYDLTTDEIDMLSDYRVADERARNDAKIILRKNRSK